MKNIYTLILLLSSIFGAALSAEAQYYDIATQLPNVLSPILSGSGRYKGFAEARFLKGIGANQADILDFSTSQGYQYNNWFYMGAGLGVDILFAHQDSNWGNGWQGGYYDNIDPNRSSTTTGVMIPLFTDFRFTIPAKNASSPSFFADLRLGASFLIGRDYIRINNGYLTNNEYFYLSPTIGVRIPVNKEKPRQAVNIGLSYQLLTSNYWTGYSNSVTLNSLGLSASFEW